MKIGDDTWPVVLLTAGIIILMVIASFGFNLLSRNPSIPRMSIEMHDAPEPVGPNETGEGILFVIEHTGGDSAPLGDLEIIIGSRANGIVFGSTNDWSPDLTGIAIEARLNGDPIAANRTFGPGDTIQIVKLRGRLTAENQDPVTVRLWHSPSNTAIARQSIVFG